MKYSYSINRRITPQNIFSFNFCGSVKGKDILDIGCSFGWFEKKVLEKGAKRVVGIEPKEEFFYGAKKEVPEAEFKLGSATKIPFKDESFDMVVMFEVLEHLSAGTERQAFKEIHRVLKPGGKLVMSTPNKSLFSCLLDPAWYFGHRHYTGSDLIDMIQKEGFVIEKMIIKGGFWELISVISHYIFKWIFKSEDPFRNFFAKKTAMELKEKNGFNSIFLKAVKKI